MNAEQAKLKNIIDMAFGFSAMTRVFEGGSDTCIEKELADVLPRIASAKSKEDLDKCHHSFCQWFTQNSKTAKKSSPASYGQGAKVLNVVLKVYVHYCQLPAPETAEKIKKWLHAAIDTKMLKHLKEYDKGIPDSEAKVVDKGTYGVLQRLVRMDINRKFSDQVLPVQWDDIMWRKLNK